jgi:hypothetical protein
MRWATLLFIGFLSIELVSSQIFNPFTQLLKLRDGNMMLTFIDPLGKIQPGTN